MAEQESLHRLRPFLRNWLWEHGRVGTRYLNCVNGELGYDEGKKARFADEQPICVSLAGQAEGAARTAARSCSSPHTVSSSACMSGWRRGSRSAC